MLAALRAWSVQAASASSGCQTGVLQGPWVPWVAFPLWRAGAEAVAVAHSHGCLDDIARMHTIGYQCGRLPRPHGTGSTHATVAACSTCWWVMWVVVHPPQPSSQVTTAACTPILAHFSYRRYNYMCGCKGSQTPQRCHVSAFCPKGAPCTYRWRMWPKDRP